MPDDVLTAGRRDAEPLVSAVGLEVAIAGRRVLQQIDLTVDPGEIVTLIGPNGSGKTTLIRALLGLVKPSAGHVVQRPGVRTGYVPQHLQVDDTLPMPVGRFLRLCAPGGRGQFAQVLAEVGAAELLESPLQAISGGELRRVLLAQALLREPDLLVLDEPSAGIDVAGQAELYTLIKSIRDRRRCGVLLVSHDLHLVMAATDRVICLNHHVCCSGRPESVSQHPEYLALFGPELGRRLAVYTHQHDHHHHLSGEPVEHHEHHEHDG